MKLLMVVLLLKIYRESNKKILVTTEMNLKSFLKAKQKRMTILSNQIFHIYLSSSGM